MVMHKDALKQLRLQAMKPKTARRPQQLEFRLGFICRTLAYAYIMYVQSIKLVLRFRLLFREPKKSQWKLVRSYTERIREKKRSECNHAACGIWPCCVNRSNHRVGGSHGAQLGSLIGLTGNG